MDGPYSGRLFGGESGRMLRRTRPDSALAYLAVLALLPFMVEGLWLLTLLLVCGWLFALAAGVRRQWRSSVTAAAAMGLVIVVLNPLVAGQGPTVLAEGPSLPVVGRLIVTAEALSYGLRMALRLMGVVSAFALYTAVVDSDATVRLLAQRWMRSALVVALAVRFIPSTARDAGRIADAMRSRGLGLGTGSRLQRARARLPILKNLLYSSLDRAVSLAEAMEARGFGRANARPRRLVEWRGRDTALVVAAVLACLVAAWRPGPWPMAGLLAFLLSIPPTLGWGWSRWTYLKSII